MTFYEQLEKHLSVKQHVLVQDEDGEYCVFSQFTDSDGFFRRTPFGAYEIAMMYIGCGSKFTKELIEENAEERNWRIIKAFDIPTGRFQVGDKVLVSEDAKELCEEAGIYWNIKMNDILGQVCVIKKINNIRYEVYTPNKSDSWEVPHSALSYPIETEKDYLFKVSYNGKRFEMFGIDQDKDGRIQITTEEDLGFSPYEQITLNDRVYIIKDVRHNPPNFFNPDDSIVIEAYPLWDGYIEEENTAAQEAIKLLEKNGYVISKK